jgi:hypothetical protein
VRREQRQVWNSTRQRAAPGEGAAARAPEQHFSRQRNCSCGCGGEQQRVQAQAHLLAGTLWRARVSIQPRLLPPNFLPQPARRAREERQRGKQRHERVNHLLYVRTLESLEILCIIPNPPFPLPSVRFSPDQSRRLDATSRRDWSGERRMLESVYENPERKSL